MTVYNWIFKKAIWIGEAEIKNNSQQISFHRTSNDLEAGLSENSTMWVVNRLLHVLFVSPKIGHQPTSMLAQYQ